jgi:hypothetical protein
MSAIDAVAAVTDVSPLFDIRRTRLVRDACSNT